MTYTFYRYSPGVLVTGFEKGSIVVWHNIVQYYLSALSQTLNSASATPAVETARYDILSKSVDE